MIQSLAALMAALALGGAQDPVQVPPIPATQLEDVEVVYLPLQPTGCVFQAVQRQEQVRKGGK